MTNQPLPDHHIGRSWTTHEIEDNCPCPKAACGLVVLREATAECQEHHWSGSKSIRQSHPAGDCPGSQPRAVHGPDNHSEIAMRGWTA